MMLLLKERVMKVTSFARINYVQPITGYRRLDGVLFIVGCRLMDPDDFFPP
jgi:hypothetical protein